MIICNTKDWIEWDFCGTWILIEIWQFFTQRNIHWKAPATSAHSTTVKSIAKSFLEMMEMFQSHIFYIFIRKANTNLKLRIFLPPDLCGIRNRLERELTKLFQKSIWFFFLFSRIRRFPRFLILEMLENSKSKDYFSDVPTFNVDNSVWIRARVRVNAKPIILIRSLSLFSTRAAISTESQLSTSLNRSVKFSFQEFTWWK